MGDARDDVHVSSACECMPGSAQSVKMECDLRAHAVLRPCDRWNAGLAHGCVWQGAGSPGDEHVAMHVARADGLGVACARFASGELTESM